MPKRKQMPGESPLYLTPREAAALDRLLEAYCLTEESDPGIDDLRSIRQKVLGIGQNHIAYATWRTGGPAAPATAPNPGERMNAAPVRIEEIKRGQVVAGVGPVLNEPGVEVDGKVRIVTEQETITGCPGEFLQVWMDSGSNPGGGS